MKAYCVLVISVLAVFAWGSTAIARAEKKAEKKPARESVVLMPLRPTKDIPQE